MIKLPPGGTVNTPNLTIDHTTQSPTQPLVVGVASPAPTTQINHENCSFAQTIVLYITPTKAAPIDIIDIEYKLIPQRFILDITSSLEHKFD